MKKHVFLTLFLFIAFSLSAQNFNISSTSVNINCTTGGTLYDSGGSTGTYANNQNFVFTVCPGSPGFGVFANMTTMAIAQGDVLNIYNGNSTAAPLFPDMPLDQNTAYALGAQFQASVTNPTGCLTFEFISNNDGQNGNFVFGLTCNPRCQEFYSNIAFSIPDTTLTATDTYIDVCLGDTVFVTATDSFPQNNTEYAQSNATSTFQWFWDLGTNVPDLGISQSHYYDAPGGYIARLISYDVNGCRNTQDKLFKVRVAPIPLFVDLTDSILCLGQSDTLTGLPQGTIINGQIVQGDTVYFVPPFYSGDSTFLPDGNGAVYSSPAVLSGFDQGALIENCGDILEVCINMEHSYLGDLNIALVCPNGQSVTLKAYPGGGGTFLGNPYDNGTQALGPGSGLDYCFSGTSTNGLLVNGPTQAATLEPGNTIVPNTYQPVTPFTNLIGCPINGLWQLQITDNLTIDDGYIFNWSLDIHPCMYPEVDSFIMVYDLGYWDSDPTITGIVNDSNTITIQPSTLGSYAYTYHTQNQFGCLYDHTYDIFVDGFTVNATPSDTTVCAGDPVPLVANVAGSVSSCNYSLQLTDTWGDGWNGATLTVLFNGVVFNAYTIATGSSATYNFSAPGGTVVSFNMTGGTFPNEVIYSISTNGSVIYSSGPNPTVGNNVFSTTCGGYYTYNWSPPTNLSSATIQNPIATVSTGTVNYTVAVTNINGCTYYDTATVNNSSSFQFAAYGDTIICAGDTAQLFATGGALSYIWTPNNSTISDTSAASPYVYPTSTTTYTVQADSTGCSQFENIVVQVSNIQVINYIVTPATCGLSNGGLIIFANGGISPLTFSKNGGLTTQANGFFQNLAGGTYHIQITDNSNCPLDTFITIPGGSAPVIDTILTNNPTCGNVNDGTIQIILTDTLSTFTYVNTTTSTTQTNNLFTGLAGNTYNFTITGAGCPPIDTMVTLSQPTPLVLALDTAINVSCFNALDGQIVLETTGGAPIYSYSIDGVNFQLANTFNALDSGTYTFIVQDNNTCFDTLVASITAPDALLLSNIAITDAACFGANGFIQFEAQGGTAPYLFSINGGTSYSAADSFNVPAGNYTLQVQDNNNCLSNVVLDTIVQPSLLTVVLDSTHNANCGVSDGGVYVSVNGGTLPYTYSWSDGAIVVGNTEDLNLINAGIYTLIVTDDSLCSATVTGQVFDNAAVVLAITAFDSVSCFGAADASVLLNADFGTMPYSFTVNGGTAQSDSLFTNVSGGLNTFEVTDANGCTNAQQIIIFEPMPLNLTSVETNVSCFGAADGEIDLTATGGTMPYLFALNTSILPQAGTNFNALADGTYTAYIADANACLDTLVNIVLTAPDSLFVAAIVSNDVSCFGSADGSLVITAQGGTLPYQYVLNGGTAQLSNTFNNLSGGTYAVNVIDANSCPITIAYDTITEPTQIVLTVDSTKNISCFNANDGFIQFSATGGSAPYTYSINNGTSYSATNLFNNLSAGTYTLIIKDVNNCTSATQNITLTQPAALSFNTTNFNVSCFGMNDGSIIITNVNGGTAPYEVALNGIFQANYTPNLSLDSLMAGTYSVAISDVNQCTFAQNYTISQPNELVLAIDAIEDVSCFGLTDGGIKLSVSGGTANYNFVVGAITQTSNGVLPTEFNLFDAGTYVAYVFDNNLCADTLPFTINEPNALVIDSIVSLNEISCFGYDDAALLVIPSGGYLADPLFGDYTYLWSPSGITDHKASGLGAGVHTVTVTDDNGCSVSASATVNPVAPILANIIPDSALINMGDTLQLGVNIQNAAGPLTYSWSPSIGLSCTDCENPLVTIYNDIAYSVVVTDSSGCANYNFTEVYVMVDNSLFFFIPNSFSPNGDGINDRFQIFGQDIQNVTSSIYNRWGEKIFEGTNQFQSWDGTYKGVEQGPGVYTYVINVKFLNDAEVNRKGSLTLIK